MLALYLILLVVPACAILLWDRFVSRVVPHAWWLYAATGFVGSPIHELAHMAGCAFFQLPVRKVVFYKPDRSTGQMGYVLFAYRPDSWWHRIGMAAQGIAPLIAGACITTYALDLQPYAPEAISAQSLAEWLWSAASTPIPALWALMAQGARGILLVVLVVCVSQHAIPSIADMRIGWKGTSALLLLFIVLSALAFWLFGAGFVIPSHLPVLRHLFLAIEHWLWCLAFGVVGIITITVSAAVFLLFIPSLILRFLSMATKPKE